MGRGVVSKRNKKDGSTIPSSFAPEQTDSGNNFALGEFESSLKRKKVIKVWEHIICSYPLGNNIIEITVSSNRDPPRKLLINFSE